MRKKTLLLLMVFSCSLVYLSCGKDDSDPPPPNPCAGVTVAVTGTVTNATTGQSNGRIVVTATGGSGFTFSINGGAYGSSATFSNLAAGSYTISAKNSNGCIGSAQFTVGTTNVCAGVNITVSSTTTNATPCSSPNNGSITATGAGSTGFTYSLNNGTFQASGTFNNLAAGSYTVVAKDNNGCTSPAATVTVNAAPAGPLFAAVKEVLNANCVSCHSSSNSQGGMNWTVDCNIVANKSLIKTKAVDQAGTPQQMPQPPLPPLSAADQKKITDWIAAGGNYSN